MRRPNIKRSAFPETGMWYKGNLHSHTTLSDGLVTPDDQVADYRRMGYDFLAITDHNLMHTHAQLCTKDFTLLPGWERDIPYGTTKCLHVVGLFPANMADGAVVKRERGNAQTMSQQQLINQMLGENVFVVLAHPVWSRMEPEEIRSLQGFHAIEVFNTGTERLCHAGHAEVHWDMLLRSGRRVYGVACDDTHGKTKHSDRFGGWVMVRANEPTKESILSALRNGAFYATQGPHLNECYVDDDYLHISCSPCSEIHVISYPPRGTSAYAEDTLLTEFVYPLKGGETYIRIECIDEQGRIAWSNPIFLED